MHKVLCIIERGFSLQPGHNLNVLRAEVTGRLCTDGVKGLCGDIAVNYTRLYRDT